MEYSDNSCKYRILTWNITATALKDVWSTMEFYLKHLSANIQTPPTSSMMSSKPSCKNAMVTYSG